MKKLLLLLLLSGCCPTRTVQKEQYDDIEPVWYDVTDSLPANAQWDSVLSYQLLSDSTIIRFIMGSSDSLSISLDTYDTIPCVNEEDSMDVIRNGATIKHIRKPHVPYGVII